MHARVKSGLEILAGCSGLAIMHFCSVSLTIVKARQASGADDEQNALLVACELFIILYKRLVLRIMRRPHDCHC